MASRVTAVMSQWALPSTDPPAPKVVSTPTVTQSPVQLTPQATQISTSDKATETPVEAPEASPNKTAPAVNEQTAKPDGQED